MIATYHEARVRALERALSEDPTLLVLGGSLSLPFNPDDGLAARHPERILVPPISEFATAATAIGASIAGLRTLVPFSTSSFLFYGFAPVVNEAANVRYLSGGAANAPVTFHMMCGSRRGGGAQHEHTSQAMFQNVPGLRVIAPGTPASVDGALDRALTGEDPTVLIDHILLAPYEGELGQEPCDVCAPTLLREGPDAMLVSYSLMLQRCLEAAQALSADGIEVAVLEVATLAPLAVDELLDATARHERLVFVDESRAAGSPASHMLARVAEARPGTRCRLLCTLDAPAPFATHLLDELVPTSARIAAETRALITR
ncbi:MAG TPA: transketolase C-terminal domain-containing protein [Solirubrobacteraceae bacterium]